ncbi:MAG: DHA2 family efflux MFS transporter permease subunit [Gammaproteobacteria bacterium]|nr:DHA2 family efflux MFS transporter permease subunit [Gammaproteobacteria bacterium]
MNVLDVSIANVSIPTIAGELAVSPNQGTWVITSFAVSNAVAVPISGWLARRFGEVRLFVACTLLFTLFSFLCGAALNFPMLLLARALQGAAAGPMIPLSQSLMLSNYPPERHGFANGIWGMTAVVGPVAGPVLGGWITDDYAWQWIFYINVPIGILAAGVTWWILRQRETRILRLPVDAVGLILLIVGVFCLQVMLDKGNDLAWFGSPMIVTLGLASAFALTLFVAWELTDKHPLVDLRLFKQRNFTVATSAMTFGYMAYFSGVVLLPLWLQTSLNYDPTWAGITTASLGIFGVFLSPVVGRFADKVDLRVLVTFGMLLFAGLSFLMSDADTQISFQRLFLVRLPWGIGMPFFFIPLITLSLRGLAPDTVAAASGLFNFMRLIALSIGTSLSVALWDAREAFHDQAITAQVNAANPMAQHWLSRANELGLSPQQALGELATQIKNQAFMQSLNEIYWLVGWLFVGLSVLVWFSRPPRAGAPLPAAAGAH